jgi:hypothetical protein
MRVRRGFAGSPLVLAALLLVAVAASAADAGDGRVVAIGDLHGVADAFEHILANTGLVDEELHWSGGTSTLVQLGDITDRGPEVRRILDLLMRLQVEAGESGGQVVVLLGNHEVLNLIGLLDEVHPGTYSSFAGQRSEQRRAQGYSDFKRYLKQRARAIGRVAPSFTREIERSWMEKHPPGYLEYVEALGPDGIYGGWLRQLPVVARIGDTLFVHAGISPLLDGLGIAEINQRARDDLADFDRFKAEMVAAGMVLPEGGLSRMSEALRNEQETLELLAVEGRPAGPERQAQLQRLQAIRDWQTWLVMSKDGPVWYRGNVRGDETSERAAELQALLAGLGVKRVVVGHTPQISGRIATRFDNQVVMIDTAIYRSSSNQSRLAALEIDNGTVTAVYPDRREVLVEPARECWTYQLLDAEGSPLPFQSDQEVLEFLATAREVSRERIETGITNPELLLLEKDGVRAHAVLRLVNQTRRQPMRRQQSLALDAHDRYVYEVAAYEVSRLLGFNRVPPVVRRSMGRKGSLQIWLEDTITDEQRRQRQLSSPQLVRWRQQWQIMSLFDNLIANRDRNQGNILIDRSWSIWYIDHTRAFLTSKEPFSLERINHCERRVWQALQAVTDGEIRDRLSPHLSPFEIDTFLTRRQRVVKHLEQLIAELGEPAVLFDLPAPICEPVQW